MSIAQTLIGALVGFTALVFFFIGHKAGRDTKTMREIAKLGCQVGYINALIDHLPNYYEVASPELVKKMEQFCKERSY